MKTEQLYDAGLDELLALARERYNVAFAPVAIDGLSLELLQIADMTEHLDRLAGDPRHEQLVLPFWAKVWPACLVLGYAIRRLPEAPGRTVLEIGSGLGLNGLVAAARGFDVTISDNNDDALLFCRINILKNGLQDNARIRRLDFTLDRMERRFDCIIGCEVLYHEDSYRPLVKFLLRHLAATDTAEVILAMDHRRKAKKFFSLAEREFSMQKKYIGYTATPRDSSSGQGEDGPERFLCALYRLQARRRA